MKPHRKRQQGAAAVEFAIVAPVFLALFFSICEIGWVSFVQSVAERANSEIARNIQTGQIQNISIKHLRWQHLPLLVQMLPLVCKTL